MAAVTCPACGAEGPTRASITDSYDLLRCVRCGHGFLSSVPDPATLLDQYGKDYFAVHRDNRPQLKLVEARRLRWLERVGPSGPLVDVGCGIGLFLEVALAAGWEASGLEPSVGAVAEARAAGMPVSEGSFGELADGAALGVVTLWHVLEHLPDPAADLVRVRAALRPGGFVGIETPAFDSWPARIRGPRWEHYRPPEHVQYFTASSLRLLLDRGGFEVVTVRRTSFTHLSGPLQALRLERLRGWLVRRAPSLAWIKRSAETVKGALGLHDCLYAIGRRRP